ncbi:MAG: glycosyltransferase family 9 protein, partial [Janthinobacterium lividum]
MESPRPAMRGKYSIRNPLWNFVFRGLDALLNVFVQVQTRLGLQAHPQVPRLPHRILISNAAHLGDVIVATSLLPALRSAFPQVEFGFLIGSWSQPVLQDHPLVRNIHILDHWMQNRASVSKWEKWRIYRRTRAKALREIKAAQYDIAIDLYWNFPNTLPLLWQAGIPIRAAFGSAGFGPLATHCVELSDINQHISERCRTLLRRLGVGEQSLSKMTPILPPVTDEVKVQLDDELHRAGMHSSDFLVFHP